VKFRVKQSYRSWKCTVPVYQTAFAAVSGDMSIKLTHILVENTLGNRNITRKLAYMTKFCICDLCENFS